ncbi:MAG TPA: IS5 family transposase [Phycisphaerae bacterium]|nr:IS5 family transposase [Phycisphaerae bacterium]
MEGTIYPTDLTDEQWELIRPYIPRSKSGTRKGGRPPTDVRMVVNGLMYLVRTGCAWRMLPRDFGPWPTVHHYYRTWRGDGTLQKVYDALRRKVRIQAGRKPSPPRRSSTAGGENRGNRGARGYDAGKKIKGRKRPIVVDTLGLILAVVVHAADIQDRDGAELVPARLVGRFSRLKWIRADGGYAGKMIEWTYQLGCWVLQIVKRGDDVTGFVVLPKRWIVERTFAWFNRYRRLSKDYETLPKSSDSMIYPAMIHLGSVSKQQVMPIVFHDDMEVGVYETTRAYG